MDNQNQVLGALPVPRMRAIGNGDFDNGHTTNPFSSQLRECAENPVAVPPAAFCHWLLMCVFCVLSTCLDPPFGKYLKFLIDM